MDDLESKLQMLTSEYERLIAVITDRNREIENWRAKYTHLELNLQKIGDLEKRLLASKEECSSLKRRLEDVSEELEDWTVKYGDVNGPMDEIEATR